MSKSKARKGKVAVVTAEVAAEVAVVEAAVVAEVTTEVAPVKVDKGSDVYIDGLRSAALLKWGAAKAIVKPFNAAAKGAADARAAHVILNALSESGKVAVSWDMIEGLVRKHTSISFMRYAQETPLLQGIDRVAGREQAYACKEKNGALVNVWAQDACSNGKRGYIKSGAFGPKFKGYIFPVPSQVTVDPSYFTAYSEVELRNALEYITRKGDIA